MTAALTMSRARKGLRSLPDYLAMDARFGTIMRGSWRESYLALEGPVEFV